MSTWTSNSASGFGTGRRVIKTTITGSALKAALAKHQRYVDQHPHGSVDETHDWDARSRFDARPPTKRRIAPEASSLSGNKLRMAKATLRGLGR